MSGHLRYCACLALVLAGCSGADGPAAAPGEGNEDGGAPPPDAALPSFHDAGGGDDHNGSFETARPVKVGDLQGLPDTVEGPADLDYFSFEGSAGQWVTIRTLRSAAGAAEGASIGLYDPGKRPLASNLSVQAIKGENVIARLTTRLPTDGTYYVAVGDPQAAPMGQFRQAYELSVVDATTLDGYNVDDERGNDAKSATPASLYAWDIPGAPLKAGFFLGAFSSASDVDAFSFSVAQGNDVASFVVEKAGTGGDGSTAPAGKVWVTDVAGTRNLSRIDGAAGQQSMSPPLPPGDYVLFVAHPDAPLAANDFYVVRALLASDNPAESEDESNGSLATAEPLVLETASTAYVVAHLGRDDTDYFRFEATPGSEVTIHCAAGVEGSGVLGLQASVRDDQDTLLIEGYETASPINISIPMPASGKLFLRLTKSDQKEDVEGDWARCVLNAR